MLMGQVADLTSMSTAFFVPAIGYAMVLLYAVSVLVKSRKKFNC